MTAGRVATASLGNRANIAHAYRDCLTLPTVQGEGVHMKAGIAKLWKPVVNVHDLAEGERFWSALSGLSPQGRHGTPTRDEYSVLDSEDQSDGEQWILLQLVSSGGNPARSGTHLDFRVDDVAKAVQQIEEIGGTLISPPALYPTESEPMLEWAVMQDPFGNEFCVIRYPLS